MSRRLPLLLVLLVVAAWPGAGSARDLDQLFEGLAIQNRLVASPASLTRPEVDPDSGALTGAQVTDPGFFTGLVESSGALSRFSADAFTQLQNIPISSSIAAFTFSFDPATNVYVLDREGLGPLFADRAETIGRGRFSFSASYQHVDFDVFEGEELSSLELETGIRQGRVFTQSAGGLDSPDDAFLTVLLDDSGGTAPTDRDFRIGFPPDEILNARGEPSPATTCGLAALSEEGLGDLGLEGCFFTIPGLTPGAFVTSEGLVDANAQGLVPDGDAFLRIASPRLRVDTDVDVELLNLAFAFGATDRLDLGLILPLLSIDVDAEVTLETIQTFDPASESRTPCDPLDDACNVAFTQKVLDGSIPLDTAVRRETFTRSERASGIGDLSLRAKYNFLNTESVNLAARADLFLPTGREEDFLGTGKVGGGLTAIASKTFLGRIAPHLNVGLFLSEESELNQLRYKAGVDVIVHERLNVGFDVIGSHDLESDGLGDDQVSVAPGFKWNPWRRLVIAGAAIVRLNDQGLRADVIPALNLEYTFR